jgi:hypothetical protein
MTTETLWIVRLYDGFDNEWMDVSDPMPEAAAKQLAGDKNENAHGKRDAGYDNIDYYRAFEADTTMVFSRKGKLEVFGDENIR